MPTEVPELNGGAGRAGLPSIQSLVRHRMRRILLVSNLYDSFIMSEEGHLQETLLNQFLALNLSRFPDLLRVPSGDAALELLQEDDAFDLVISSLSTGSGSVTRFARELREAGYEVPVLALAYSTNELRDFLTHEDTSLLENVFLWQGDVRILIAMIKSVEDRANVAYDTGVVGVPAILLVEDNIRFYSSFLPIVYTELMRHTHRLLSEDLSLSQKMIRMQARPKVLLCTSYDQAWDYFERFESQVMGVISDFQFPRGGVLHKHAGLALCREVRQRRSDIPVVMQSSRPENRALANEVGASFLLKGSPVLLHDLRDIIVESFGFGDFVFRLPSGEAIATAHDLKSLIERLKTVPAESVKYHAERNHFSYWLKARTELDIAERLRPLTVEEFQSVEHLRQFAVDVIEAHVRERNRTIIADFDRKTFDPTFGITRMGEGSLGGKARGVAFANRVLRASGIEQRFPDVDISVPPAVVLGTQIFDEFLQHQWIREFAIGPNSDEKIIELFLAAPFPRRAVSDLRDFLRQVKYPLAVRSSSLLEDSLAQPFAGVYRTHFIPNNDPDIEVRLEQLKSAIKRVYASTFAARAKTYLSMTSFRLEQEKMAVMVQELTGREHDRRFYPDFAGVARSYNYYPEPDHEAEDGVVALALGMGRTVVDGSPCLRFCPKYPRELVTFSSVEDALRNSQREFYALDLGRVGAGEEVVGVERHGLDVAEADGSLTWLGSTYSPDDDRVVDGISRPGIRLVSFAQILKHEAYPLAPMIDFLLKVCSHGTGAPVEIEFAGNLGRGGEPHEFSFLQLRPLAVARERDDVEIRDVDDAEVVCRSRMVLGNGRLEGIRDLVVVDIDTYDRSRSPEIALQVARFDGQLRKQARPYVLIGVGRWGSADPSLGIPVTWDQISGASVIVETGFKDLRVEPSQGTHFFQNLSSCNVGYFTVNPSSGEGLLDWDWLAGRPATDSTEFVRHVQLADPVTVIISAEKGEGIVLKPRSEQATESAGAT